MFPSEQGNGLCLGLVRHCCTAPSTGELTYVIPGRRQESAPALLRLRDPVPKSVEMDPEQPAATVGDGIGEFRDQAQHVGDPVAES
ncbi:hypothetical protein, partial [Actinacidiphila oryziradicis]|uniref:hypothetical protein n=1 Tax=Actinacidiphila oryziradicis TaxID=2571141 RepID=UPI0023F3E182